MKFLVFTDYIEAVKLLSSYLNCFRHTKVKGGDLLVVTTIFKVLCL